MGGPNKLLALYRGHPLISWAAEAARGAAVASRILVTGRDGEAVARAAGAGFTCVHNEAFTDGLASSLRLGLAEARDCDGAVVLLADMPEVDAALIHALVKARTERAYAVVPVAEERIGNPVLLGREAIADCLGLAGDRGARPLLEKNARRLVRVPATPAIFKDLDTIDDFDV
jgi:molybdenum cofactor cytidylyltransferase